MLAEKELIILTKIQMLQEDIMVAEWDIIQEVDLMKIAVVVVPQTLGLEEHLYMTE